MKSGYLLSAFSRKYGMFREQSFTRHNRFRQFPNQSLQRTAMKLPPLNFVLGNKKGHEMMKRPTSVNVIAWILIVTSGISLISSTVSLNNPMAKELMAKSLMPIPLQYVMLYVGLLITIVAGIAMLKGQNWARFLYVVWSAIGFVIGIVTSPMLSLIHISEPTRPY